MSRHLKYVVPLVGLAVLIITWCGSAGAQTAATLRFDAAREAEQTYRKQLKDLHAEFELKKQAALETCVKRLAALQKAYTTASDLDGALAIRLRIEALKNPPEPEKERKAYPVGLPMAELRGAWMVEFSNKTRATRTFHGRNQVNNRARLSRKRRDLIIEHPKNVIERITLADGRLFVEHFNPKKTYPKGKLVVLGVGKKLD